MSMHSIFLVTEIIQISSLFSSVMIFLGRFGEFLEVIVKF